MTLPQLSKQDLSPDQLKALKTMTAWYTSDQAIMDPFLLRGAAGTGKTSILSVFLNELQILTFNVMGLATSAMAAKNIGDKTGIVNVKTLASFLKMPQTTLNIDYHGHIFKADNYIDASDNLTYIASQSSVGQQHMISQVCNEAITRYHLIHSKSTNNSNNANQYEKATSQTELLSMIDVHKLNQVFHRSHMFTLTTRFTDRTQDMSKALKRQLETLQLIIVDEISMISASDIDSVLTISRDLHIPVMLVGDPFQLSPVNDKASDLLFDHYYPFGVTLLKLHRQSNLIAVLGSLLRPPYHLSLRQALDYLYSHYKSVPEVVCANSNTIAKAKQDGQFAHTLNQNDIVLAQTNRQVQLTTDLMRQDKYNLSSRQSRSDGLRLHDKIRVSMNEITGSKSKVETRVALNERYMNGMLGEIINIHDDKLIFDEIYQIDPMSASIYQQLHLKCVDIQFEDGRIRHNIFVNTLLFHDPKVNSSSLYDYRIFNINGLKSKAPWFYHHFQKTILEDSNSSFYDMRFHHASIIYITFGYVLTIYKAQGREWNKVVFMAKGAFGSLSNQQQMNYTAVTRAKKQLIVLLCDAS